MLIKSRFAVSTRHKAMIWKWFEIFKPRIVKVCIGRHLQHDGCSVLERYETKSVDLANQKPSWSSNFWISIMIHLGEKLKQTIQNMTRNSPTTGKELVEQSSKVDRLCRRTILFEVWKCFICINGFLH